MTDGAFREALRGRRVQHTAHVHALDHRGLQRADDRDDVVAEVDLLVAGHHDPELRALRNEGVGEGADLLRRADLVAELVEQQFAAGDLRDDLLLHALGPTEVMRLEQDLLPELPAAREIDGYLQDVARRAMLEGSGSRSWHASSEVKAEGRGQQHEAERLPRHVGLKICGRTRGLRFASADGAQAGATHGA
jgi:hypothetical protein